MGKSAVMRNSMFESQMFDNARTGNVTRGPGVTEDRMKNIAEGFLQKNGINNQITKHNVSKLQEDLYRNKNIEQDVESVDTLF